MKLAHFSDAHLGAVGRGYQRRVDDPFSPGARILERSADLMLAFHRAVEGILAARPDLVIHTGDLFDSAKPAISVVDFAMRQLSRLAAQVPVIVVEGHHCFPRERAAGHAVQLLEHVPGVTVAYDKYKAVQVDDLPIVVHAVPHEALATGTLPKQDDLDPDRANVLATHGVADNVPFYQTYRPAPPVLLAGCEEWYEYIALGHHHRFCQANFRRRAFYAGSLAMVDWGDFSPAHVFSFNLVELGGDEPRVTRVPIQGRAMHAYGLTDAAGLTADEILRLIENQVAAVDPAGSYCLVELNQLERLARSQLRVENIRDLFSSAACMQLEFKERERPWQQMRILHETGGSAAERYKRLVTLSEEYALRADVLALGLQHLDAAEEKIATAAD